MFLMDFFFHLVTPSPSHRRTDRPIRRRGRRPSVRQPHARLRRCSAIYNNIIIIISIRSVLLHCTAAAVLELLYIICVFHHHSDSIFRADILYIQSVSDPTVPPCVFVFRVCSDTSCTNSHHHIHRGICRYPRYNGYIVMRVMCPCPSRVRASSVV